MGKPKEISRLELWTPTTVAQFRKWLVERIAWLRGFPDEIRNPEDYRYVKATLEEAYELALDLGLPESAEVATRIGGPIVVRLQQCLQAIPEPPDRGVYSLKQAADRLGVSRRTVGRLIDSGELKCNRVGSRKTITKKQLEDYQQAEADSESLFG